MKPDRSCRRLLFDSLAFLAVLAGLGWLIIAGAGDLHYNWQWYRIPQYFYRIDDGVIDPGPLLRGLAVTLELTGWSLLLTIVLGLAAASIGTTPFAMAMKLVGGSPIMSPFSVIRRKCPEK